MRINKDFTIQQVGGSYVAVAVGETSRSFHGMIRLNETAAFLWRQMSLRDCTEEELVDALLASYEGVDRATATEDVRKILSVLSEHKILLQ